MKKYVFITVAALIGCTTVKGQSVLQIEGKLSNYLDQITKWDSSQENDSLDVYNKKMLDYLKVVLVKNDSTLDHNFQLKQMWFHTLTSSDKNFKIYCWDVGAGGGTRSNNVIVQYRSNKKTKVKIISDVSTMMEGEVSMGLSYGQIYTITSKTKKVYYVATGAQKVSMGLYLEDVQAFCIEDTGLNTDAKLFKTSKGSISSISFTFEASRSGYKDATIKMSTDKQRLFIPLVTEDGAVTDKHLTYVFNGNQYVFDKMAQ